MVPSPQWQVMNDTLTQTVIGCGYRIDILVDDRLILELKAVEKMKDIFKAQLLTYMKLSKTPVGLLINFNVPKLVDGVQRFKI